MLTLKQVELMQQNAISHAQQNNAIIAVAITDSHGELISFVRMDGVAPHAAKLAKNKAYTAARDRQSTKQLSAWAKATNKDLSYWSAPNFTGIAGGVPILNAGNVVGAIGISGMSEDADHKLASEVITTVS